MNAHDVPGCAADFYHVTNVWTWGQALGFRVLVPAASLETARQLTLDQMRCARDHLQAAFPDEALESEDLRRGDRWKIWAYALFPDFTGGLFYFLLITIERRKRREPVFGFRHVERRTDKLFAPFRINRISGT